MNNDIANAMANLAAILGAYYLNLLEHGLPPHMAIDLVRDFQRIQLCRIFETKSAADKQNG